MGSEFLRMERLCVCPHCFPGSGIDEVIRQSARAGIRRVSLPAQNRPASVRELLRRNRIEVPILETAEPVGTPDSARNLRERIDFCVRMKVPLLNIACAPPPESEKEKADARSVLRDCAQYAAAAGVRLALETYGGVTRNAPECLRTLEAIGEPNVGINYDTGNVLRFSPELSGAELAEKDLRPLSGHVWAVHLKDCSQSPFRTVVLGRGDVDFPALFRVLDEMNFSGVPGLDLETSAATGLEDHFVALKESLRYLETLLP